MTKPREGDRVRFTDDDGTVIEGIVDNVEECHAYSRNDHVLYTEFHGRTEILEPAIRIGALLRKTHFAGTFVQGILHEFDEGSGMGFSEDGFVLYNPQFPEDTEVVRQ